MRGSAMKMVVAMACLAAPVQAAEPSAQPSACVAFQPRLRYQGFAYDHVVWVRNGCERPVQCAVSTDSNPQPVAVSLASGDQTSVILFFGSPSRVFRAVVSCRWARQ